MASKPDSKLTVEPTRRSLCLAISLNRRLLVANSVIAASSSRTPTSAITTAKPSPSGLPHGGKPMFNPVPPCTSFLPSRLERCANPSQANHFNKGAEIVKSIKVFQIKKKRIDIVPKLVPVFRMEKPDVVLDEQLYGEDHEEGYDPSSEESERSDSEDKEASHDVEGEGVDEEYGTDDEETEDVMEEEVSESEGEPNPSTNSKSRALPRFNVTLAEGCTLVDRTKNLLFRDVPPQNVKDEIPKLQEKKKSFKAIAPSYVGKFASPFGKNIFMCITVQRPFVFECNIFLEIFTDKLITLMKLYGWLFAVSNFVRVNYNVVMEFYSNFPRKISTNIKYKDGSPIYVTVRGVKVDISPGRIRQVLQLPENLNVLSKLWLMSTRRTP